MVTHVCSEKRQAAEEANGDRERVRTYIALHWAYSNPRHREEVSFTQNPKVTAQSWLILTYIPETKAVSPFNSSSNYET